MYVDLSVDPGQDACFYSFVSIWTTDLDLLGFPVFGGFTPVNIVMRCIIITTDEPDVVNSNPDMSSALWDAIPQRNNVRATWLKLTRGFEGTVTL